MCKEKIPAAEVFQGSRYKYLVTQEPGITKKIVVEVDSFTPDMIRKEWQTWE